MGLPLPGDAEELGFQAAGVAVDLLSAGYAEGGKRKVIYAIVGLLTHEAIGHTVGPTSSRRAAHGTDRHPRRERARDAARRRYQ